MKRKHVLIISHDKIGENMAGPGIRYHYMAQLLSKHFDVTVGFNNSDFCPDKSFKHVYKTRVINPSDLNESYGDVDILIALWLDEEVLKYSKSKGIFTVFDIYAPVPVENLALFMYSGNPIDASVDYTYRQSYNLYEKFFEYGDLFLFSNRRQIDFWMGYVFGTGIIKVSSYTQRQLFDRFIYAPMGIDTATEISHKKDVIKGVIPGINRGDTVILWTGGIWNWFDAQTLIRSMKRIEKSHPKIKLVFFGIKHPNPNIPEMKEASETIALAKKLNLLNTSVFVHEGWVPYSDRTDYLLEADAAVNTAKESIESELAHRTRVLDHILTSLPTVATSGDYLSDEVIARDGLGVVIEPEDEEALSDAIIKIVDPKYNKKIRENINCVRSDYDWSVALSPLIESLTSSLNKLPYVENKPVKDLDKTRPVYKMAKRILPKSVKKVLIKVSSYGK